MKYRCEMKHCVKKSDFIMLEGRLKHIMKLDKHSKNNGSYNVRSIYFDTYDDDYLFKKEDGLNERFKIRIRIYNKSDEVIKLEVKYRRDGYVRKEGCLISREMCERLMDGSFLRIDECRDNKVLYKVYLEQHLHYLKPKVIVEYDRIAYTSPLGNVRITFDSDIRTSKYIHRFFCDDLFSVSISSDKCEVLEVKYDEFIPDYIMQEVELNTLSQISFSKYYLARTRFMKEVI